LKLLSKFKERTQAERFQLQGNEEDTKHNEQEVTDEWKNV
jgi:hypothetical protein